MHEQKYNKATSMQLKEGLCMWNLDLVYDHFSLKNVKVSAWYFNLKDVFRRASERKRKG